MHTYLTAEKFVRYTRTDHFKIVPFSMPGDVGNYFVVPSWIYLNHEVGHITEKNALIEEMCDSLEHFYSSPENHIFFIAGDSTWTPPVLEGSLIFRHSCLEHPKQFALPYQPQIRRLSAQQEWSISFCGNQTSHPIRKEMFTAFEFKDCFLHNTQVDFSLYKPEARDKLSLLNSVITAKSKYVLAPRGYAINSIRFFDALAVGKPVALLTDVRPVMPLEELVDYSKLCTLKLGKVDADEILSDLSYLDEKCFLQELSVYKEKVACDLVTYIKRSIYARSIA